MDISVNTVYTSIPGYSELGMIWMGDVMVHRDATQELNMLDPSQTEGSFYSHNSHPCEDIRNHIAPTTMVRYIPQQFSNECSEPDEAMEVVDANDIQQEYDSQSERPEMNEYLTLKDYMGNEENEQIVINAATQTTQDNRNRKMKPIKHPGLVLKTPIAYQPHTDLIFIPIRKDGIAVCEKCGAIGVKHAFYTKERRFCSRACARSSEHAADSTYSPSHLVDQTASANQGSPRETKVPVDMLVKEEVDVKESVEPDKEKVKLEPVILEDLDAIDVDSITISSWEK